MVNINSRKHIILLEQGLRQIQTKIKLWNLELDIKIKLKSGSNSYSITLKTFPLKHRTPPKHHFSLLAVEFQFLSPPNVIFIIKKFNLHLHFIDLTHSLFTQPYSSRFLSSFLCFSVHRWRKFSTYSHFDPLQDNALIIFVFTMNDSQSFTSTSDSASITTVDQVISSLSLFFIHHL